MSKEKSFNSRKFVSTGLFFIIMCLVTTGTSIQILENFQEGFALHFSTAVHVLAGFVFAILSIFHIVMNWQSLKIYLKKAKNTNVSKEAKLAFYLMIVVIFAGFIVAYAIF